MSRSSFGTRRDVDVPLDEQLALLRPGDVVTYCYSATPENILVDGTARVRDSVRDARDRGIVFDVGHGMASFDFRIAEAALPTASRRTRSPPTSTGAMSAPSPSTTCLGPSRSSSRPACRRSRRFPRPRWRPAAVLGVAAERGPSLANASADLCGLRWNADAPPLVDTEGGARPGGCWEPVFVLKAGEIVVE